MGSRYPPGRELPRYTDRDHEDAANLLEPWEDVCPGCTHVRIDGRCFHCAGEGETERLTDYETHTFEPDPMGAVFVWLGGEWKKVGVGVGEKALELYRRHAYGDRRVELRWETGHVLRHPREETDDEQDRHEAA